MSLVRRLASFVRSTESARLSDPVRREVARACFNWLGCAVGGSDRPAARAAWQAARRLGANGAVTVLGSGASADAASAAFLNGISSSVDAFDDTDAVMMLHPTSPVASAAFAVAESVGASGAAFLDAVTAGMEIEVRLCRMLALPPARPRPGVYLSGVTGAVGAAAAAAKLLELDEERTAWAMAIASVGAAGNQNALSSMCCPFVPANAARGGVMAAVLAEAGFDGSAGAIEGPRGFATVFADGAQFDAVTRGLGETFELMSITYKPYPCGIVVHAAVDAALELVGAPGSARLRAEAIESVHALVAPVTIELMGARPVPADALQAQVSAHHWIAAALVRGRAGVEESEAAALADPGITRLRSRVRLEASPDIARHETRLTLTLADGSTRAAHVPHALGSRGRPMADADLERKFRDYAGRVVGPGGIDALVSAAWRLPALENLVPLSRAALPASAMR